MAVLTFTIALTATATIAILDRLQSHVFEAIVIVVHAVARAYA